jgi:hypothetical protein
MADVRSKKGTMKATRQQLRNVLWDAHYALLWTRALLAFKLLLSAMDPVSVQLELTLLVLAV